MKIKLHNSIINHNGKMEWLKFRFLVGEKGIIETSVGRMGIPVISFYIESMGWTGFYVDDEDGKMKRNNERNTLV